MYINIHLLKGLHRSRVAIVSRQALACSMSVTLPVDHAGREACESPTGAPLASELCLCDRALLIHDEWIQKILRNGKTWEIRTMPSTFRGRFALANTTASTQYKTRMLHGEVTLVKCLEVAVVHLVRNPSGVCVGLKFLPPSHKPENFMWLDSNQSRHQVCYDVIPWNGAVILPGRQHSKLWGSKVRKLYAWALEKPAAYKAPQVLKSTFKRGQVKWVKLLKAS